MDGQLVNDNWTRQRRGEALFGAGTQEEKGIFPLKTRHKHDILVEFCNVRGPADGDEDQAVMDRYPTTFYSRFSVLKNRWHTNPGVRLGGAEVATRTR